MTSTRDLSRMALFLCLMIIGAYLQISLPTPFFTMHITLQLFVCLTAGLLLPLSQAALTMGIYILCGLAGLPVFASGGGLYYLMKPTFGFVLGFLFAAAVTAWARKKTGPAGRRSEWRAALAGLAVFYLAGNIYYILAVNYLLNTPVPLAVCLFNCFAVSIVPDLLLTRLAAASAGRLRHILH